MYLLAFHQAAPTFLDYLSSFGDTEFPLDYSMTGFQFEDSLNIAREDALCIPKLGRSGHEFRNSYIIRSVERSDYGDDDGNNEDKPWPWHIRQTAVYHSFDVVTGQAFWLTAKANDMMRERVCEAADGLPALQAPLLEDCGNGFAATLETHMIFLAWCDENWRPCINEIESELKQILIKAKTARIDREPQFEMIKPLIIRASTLRPQGPATTKGLSRSATMKSKADSLASAVQSMLVKLQPQKSGGTFQTKAEKGPGILKRTVSKEVRNDPDDQKALESLQVLDMFSFAELQKLHHIGERLDEMRLVVKLDADVLRDVREYYTSLIERDGFPEKLREKCAGNVADFCRRVKRVERNLEIRRSQLESMMGLLKDGKTLVSLSFHQLPSSAETDRHRGTK